MTRPINVVGVVDRHGADDRDDDKGIWRKIVKEEPRECRRRAGACGPLKLIERDYHWEGPVQCRRRRRLEIAG